jgi:hypothetical protein
MNEDDGLRRKPSIMACIMASAPQSALEYGVSQHHPCPGGIAGYPTNLLVASSNTRLVPEPEADASLVVT